MSRRTLYTMKLPSGGMEIKVSIAKAFGEKTGLVMTHTDPITGETKRVRTTRVIPKEDGVMPRDLEDVDKIIPWNGAQSSYIYVDGEGESRMLNIDKDVIGKLYTGNDTMSVKGFIHSSKISPHNYEGHHYFVAPQVDRKTKSVAENDKQGYALLLYTLKTKSQVILVKFVSGDREKSAIIYPNPTGECMMMGTLIHSTYQRDVPSVPKYDKLRNESLLAEKLVEKFGIDALDPDIIRDQYEERIKEYIEKLKLLEQAKREGKRVIDLNIRMKPVEHTADDFLSMLENM